MTTTAPALHECPHYDGKPMVSDQLCTKRRALAKRYARFDDTSHLYSDYRPCKTCTVQLGQVSESSLSESHIAEALDRYADRANALRIVMEAQTHVAVTQYRQRNRSTSKQGD